MAAKGYDDSPPRNGVIFFYTVLTVAVLLGVTFLLDSYFAQVMDTEVREKVLTRGLDRALATREEERAALEKSGISEAMRTLAQRGRTVSPLIAPESGAGKAAIEGWTQLKREPPPAAGSAEPSKASDVSPVPANPNGAEGAALPTTTAPSPGPSPIAPAVRPAPTAAAEP